MEVDWTGQIADQLAWHWDNQLRPRLDGLTDEEYQWEPVAGCWSIRPDATGRLMPDRGQPIPPDPAPITTIAWRLGHMGSMFVGRATAQFGDTGITEELPADAAGALVWLDQTYAAWMSGVRSLDAAGLARPTGPSEGSWADAPLATLLLHMSREIIHHGAEVSLLRDLYRAQRLDREPVRVLLNGDRAAAESLSSADVAAIRAEHANLVSIAAERRNADAVRLLVELGFDPSEPEGRSPLHAAAALGDAALCRLLVELGADHTQRDPIWNETPLGWALFLKHQAAADYLQSVNA